MFGNFICQVSQHDKVIESNLYRWLIYVCIYITESKPHSHSI